MIRERPVIELLDLEVFDGGEWVRWTSPLRSVQIMRGGERSGTTQTVEVGTLSASFVNAADPLVSEAVVPDEVVFRDGFEAGLGDWVAADGATVIWGTTPSRGTRSLDVSDGGATVLVSDLTVGHTYKLTAWRAGAAGRVATTRARTYGEATTALAGKTYADVVALAAGKSYREVTRTVGMGAAAVPGDTDTAPAYAPVEVQFKATWEEHEVRLQQAPADSATTHFDRVELTRLAYSAPVPHIRPNRPVRLVTAIGREPIWSGVTNDIDSTYSLNKDSGDMTTFVNLSAVDAVAPLVGTTRYGAVIEGDVQSETWANRINRLALSAPAGVDVEPVDARLEVTVYAL